MNRRGQSLMADSRNAHKHLERAAPDKQACRGLIDAANRSCGLRCLQPADHYRILPANILAGGQDGRMFGPLAYTKTFAMAASCVSIGHFGARADGRFVRGGLFQSTRTPVNLFF